jgi:hypothetical protein
MSTMAKAMATEGGLVMARGGEGEWGVAYL